jgi:hypothetical protein
MTRSVCRNRPGQPKSKPGREAAPRRRRRDRPAGDEDDVDERQNEGEAGGEEAPFGSEAPAESGESENGAEGGEQRSDGLHEPVVGFRAGDRFEAGEMEQRPNTGDEIENALGESEAGGPIAGGGHGGKLKGRDADDQALVTKMNYKSADCGGEEMSETEGRSRKRRAWNVILCMTNRLG